MNLKHLTDRCLLDDTQTLVRREREILTHVLHHFKELERRRLFDGHSSLFDYAIKACGYSEDQACRRIAAMRLLNDLPELEEQIEAGTINLSHVGLAQSLFQNEKKAGNLLTTEDKLEVFQAIAGKTKREAQATVARFSSTPPQHRDSIKPLGHGQNSAHLQITDETLAKIEKLKGLLAHKHPDLSISDLLDQLCDLGLEQWSPTRAPKREIKRATKAEVRRLIWKRDQSACTQCGSKFALQEDHVVPKALGGQYTLENMRLLCRTCNQRASVEKFGVDKMESFLWRT